MECEDVQRARRYLERFDQILCEMANKMLSANFTNNITLNFIECMIPHHMAAICMCENLLNFTNYEPLQRIANDIIRTQTRGIEQMSEIARTTCGYNNSECDVNRYIRRYFAITRNMICRMRNSPRCININLNFVNEMIPHHEGAVQMCNNLLQYCIDPRLRNVADSIIREQTEGIRQLKQIRNCLCNM